MSVGPWQVVLILVVILVLFGAGKLPSVMKDLAKGVQAFKKGLREEEETEQSDSKPLLKSEALPKKTEIQEEKPTSSKTAKSSVKTSVQASSKKKSSAKKTSVRASKKDSSDKKD
tara:strand:- start:929 stop:1273 length:345 start_codon:yes stop_codon:yes gene_type:complete